MKVENSIKEKLISTTIKPLTNLSEIIDAICEWNSISLEDFKRVVWNYTQIGKDDSWNPIYSASWVIIDPIEQYLNATYRWKEVVFESGNEKYFGKINITKTTPTRYMLGDKVIDIPFKIRALNEDNGDWITIFPKVSDIIQPRMKKLYVINPGRAERQRLEKEIMAKLIELAQVRGWNEIISSQNVLEDLQSKLAKDNIKLSLWNGIMLELPRRTIRDTAGNDDDYIAPPIEVSINFDSRIIESRGYSCHWFGTPNSWWSPCWWNWDRQIRDCLRDCDLKWLINLVISWAYGYNSNDTGISHDWRHPLGKLKDYFWYIYDHKSQLTDEQKQNIKQNIKQIKHDLNIDGWLGEAPEIEMFLNSLE